MDEDHKRRLEKALKTLHDMANDFTEEDLAYLLKLGREKHTTDSAYFALGIIIGIKYAKNQKFPAF